MTVITLPGSAEAVAKARPLARHKVQAWTAATDPDLLADGILIGELAAAIKLPEKTLRDVLTLLGWVVRCDPASQLPLWYPNSMAPSGDGCGEAVPYQQWRAALAAPDSELEEKLRVLGQLHPQCVAILSYIRASRGDKAAEEILAPYRDF